jgi:Fe2+ transport system protein B
MTNHTPMGNLPERIPYRTLLKIGLYNGAKKGGQAFLWMMKIILPVSLLTSLLAWSGWLERMDVVIGPLMKLFGLPPMAALPLLIGMLTGIYGGIAAMVVLPFDAGQMTLMGIFLLMAHNLIQEGIVQGQSGIHPVTVTLFRLITASVTLIIISPWVIAAAPGAIAPIMQAGPTVQPPFLAMLGSWLEKTAWLCLQMFVIIMAILILLEIVKTLDWILPIVRFFAPLLKLMGLDQKVGLLWMTAVVFGLAYGGAVIVEEAKAEHLSKEDLKMLHLSISINHSMVEDPLLFISLGLSAPWLYIPRFVVAVATVHLIRLWFHLSGRAAR